MKIGIDARLLSTKIRGTSRYLSNVIKYIPQFDQRNQYYIFQYEDIPQNQKFYSYISIKRSVLPRQIYEHYWLNFILPNLLSDLEIKIFFTPYVFVPFIKRNWKNVIAIHDSLTKVCKEYYTFHYRKYMDLLVPPSVKRSDAIVTVSKSAMNDIIKYYDVKKEKIQYLHLWTDDKYHPIDVSNDEKQFILNKYNLPDKFIFFVSVLEERKNIDGIIKISDLLFQRGIDIKFVLVGREGYGYDKISNEIKIRDNRIIHLKEVDEQDLVLLYNIATIFLFPSHYEGFGLPPLEAMKCGLPVITSNNSSLPEVVGNGGLLGNSDDYNFFANNIIELLRNQNLYSLMKTKAIEQSKKFTPERHITELVNIFNRLN
jgi:glycosyltransferase involved in cell wall biosynthesis